MFTLPACAHTIAGPWPAAQRRGERVRPHRALPVGRHDLDRRAPEPQQPQRPPQRHVRLLAREHADRWRAAEALLLDVPAPSREQRVPRRRQAGHVRHLRAGREPDAGLRGQPQQLQQPRARHLLDDRGGR